MGFNKRWVNAFETTLVTVVLHLCESLIHTVSSWTSSVGPGPKGNHLSRNCKIRKHLIVADTTKSWWIWELTVQEKSWKLQTPAWSLYLSVCPWMELNRPHLHHPTIQNRKNTSFGGHVEHCLWGEDTGQLPQKNLGFLNKIKSGPGTSPWSKNHRKNEKEAQWAFINVEAASL